MFATGTEIDTVEFLLTKSKCWEYEDEWRMFNDNPESLVEFDRDALTGVYFGAKTPPEKMREISQMIGGARVRTYQMGMLLGTFKLIVT